MDSVRINFIQTCLKLKKELKITPISIEKRIGHFPFESFKLKSISRKIEMQEW